MQANAQAVPPATTGTVTRGPPYGKEDVGYLEGKAAAARAAFEKALNAWEAAGAEPGSIRDELREAEKVMQSVEADLEKARTAPARDEVILRLEYNQLLARIALAHERLVIRMVDGRPVMGELAKSIARAEDTLKELTAAGQSPQRGSELKALLEKRMTDLERLDEKIRGTDEQIAFIERLKRQLEENVLGGYVRYEDEVAAAIQAWQSLDALWLRLRRSPALSYGGPAPAPNDVARKWFEDGPEPGVPGIRRLWAERAGLGRVKDEPLVITRHAGALARYRLELGELRLLRSAQFSDSENLRTLEAQSKTTTAAPVETGVQVVGNSEYARLGARIASSKVRFDLLEQETLLLDEQIEAVSKELGERSKNLERTNAAINAAVEELQKDQTNFILSFPKTDRTQARAILSFVKNERLAASRQDAEALAQATRRVEIRRDVLARRRSAVQDEQHKIRDVQLPSLRVAYYRSLFETLGIRGLRVLLVVGLTFLLVRMLRRGGNAFIARIMASTATRPSTGAIGQQRARTLVSVFVGALRFFIYLLAGFFVVGQLDIDYGPLLVAAGGLSLAVGFGAQALIRDFFAGFFILLEGQYSIGDVVDIEGKAGVVEDLNLRTTVLRSLNGEVHTIPNGEISMTTNKTKGWSRSVVDVPVAYEEDVDQVIAVLAKVGEELRGQEGVGHKIRNFEVLGVEGFGERSINVRVLVETFPGDQWAISRQFLRRVKIRFDELGIEIPWPQIVMTQKTGTTDAMARSRKDRAVRRFVGNEVDPASTGSFSVLSVEARDRAEAIAQKEAQVREQLEAEREPETVVEKAPEPIQGTDALSLVSEAKQSDSGEEVSKPTGESSPAKREGEHMPAENGTPGTGAFNALSKVDTPDETEAPKKEGEESSSHKK